MVAVIMLKLKFIKYVEVKRFFFRFSFCLVFASLIPPDRAFCGNTSSSSKSPSQVLALHSYYPTFTWSDNITQGIRKTFAEHGRSETLISFEFLDAKQHPEEEYLNRTAELLQIKYPDPEAIDVIICSDDQALNFLLERTHTLFPGVPVVFCGVNGYTPQMKSLGRPLTGVIESIDPKSTLEAALSLQPHIREVLVINDITRTGQAIENTARQIFKPFEDKLLFRYVGDMTIAELRAEVSALSKDTIVFLFVFNRDNNGVNFTHEASLESIAAHCKVPIYGPWTFYLGKGIVGGMLTSGETQGETAARLALRILDGERAENIPVVMQSPNRYMFDHRQLALHNLPLDKLPPGSEIINRPVGFYEKYRYRIWAGGLALMLQAGIIILLLFNIRRRKHAENKLISSEKKYRILVETMTDAVFTLDINGRFTFLNPEFENITGLPARDFIGQPFTEILAPEYIESTVDRFKRGVSGETIPVYEVEVKHKDENTVPVELKVTSLFDEHGKTTGRIGVARDVSERKNTEKTIRENERFLQNVFDGIHDGISVLGRDLTIVKVNAWMEKLYRERMPLVGKKCYEVYQQRQSPCPWCPSIPALESGEVHSEIVPYPSPVGPQGWIDLSAFPLKDADGSVIGIIEHVKDITDRQSVEDALRRSELELSVRNRIADIFLTVPDDEMYAKVLDIVLEAMQSKLGIFGYIDEQGSLVCPSMTRDIWDQCRIPDKDIIFPREQWGGIWGRAMLEKKTLYSNKKFKVPEGHIPITRSLNVPIIHQKEVIGIFSVGNKETDYDENDKRLLESISDYIAPVLNARLQRDREADKGKKLQAQLQQSQRMEALGTLGGGIAHDFNNLLMGIQGRTSLMLMDVDSSHPHFEHLKGIEDYVKSAADLTKQLLGFARGGKYEVKPIDMNDMIKTSSRMFGRTKKEIKIHGKYQKDVWTVEADRGQIEQVLVNLYVNAWQAMPAGGELYLQTENVGLDEDYIKPFEIEPGRYVKISVTDTGLGMDEATRQKVFDPFFTTKKMGRGTGLGLASTYGIIKNHGGIINVYSEKGQGTTFNIYLPASKNEVLEEKKLPKHVLRGSETVLLVDDEDMIIEIGTQLLQKLGYKVLRAGSGKEAIEIYKNNKDKIDMVIVDMIMPEMSGGDTFDRLKEMSSGVKVLLSSGYSINGQATEILARGCDGFIQKPFNMEQLSRKLREVFDKDSILL
jgi:PAS domain S-box-containing protein